LMQAIAQMSRMMNEQNQLINNLKKDIDKKGEHSDAVNTVVMEYMTVRKYSDINLPGLNVIIDEIADIKGRLPGVKIEFTATEWLNSHASNLSQRQRICFFKEIASAHRFLVGSMPEKIKGVYQYSNDYEILFQRAKFIAESMIPGESKALPQSPVILYQDLIALTEDEQALVGSDMKLTTLSICLGERLSVENASRLAIFIKGLVKSGEIAKPKNSGGSNKLYTVTPRLIFTVKNFIRGVN